MQFQVPQFIETEDKIIGPFTLRQFMYFAGAAVITFFLYFTVQLWLVIAAGIFFSAIAFALAFVKIGGRSLAHVITAAFNFYWKPQTYVWQPARATTSASVAAEGGEKPKQPGMSLEEVITGTALRSAWQNLQTGSKMSNQQFLGNTGEHYQVYQRLTGDRAAARRVDYR